MSRPAGPARSTRAAVCRAFSQPLAIEELTIRPPSAGEILMRVLACGICSSDIAYLDGAWGGTLPAVYGHEAAGVVEQVGPGVAGLAPGDHIVVTLIRSCGDCRTCRAGRPAVCQNPPAAQPAVLEATDGRAVHQGMRTGAFSELALVHSSQAVAVPADLRPEAACLLGCGVLTGIGAVAHTAAVEPGSTVVVLGTGGVGLNCVQGAAIAGAAEVIAVDVVARKLDAAAAFGASATVDSSADAAEDAVRRLTAGRGADYVFVAAGSAGLVEEGARMAARGGTLVIVGMPRSGTLTRLDPLAISDGSLRILGSKMGDSDPRRDIPSLVKRYRDGSLKLDELVSACFGIGRVNDAITSAKRGEQLRPVLVFGESGRAGDDTAARGTGEERASCGSQTLKPSS
jgi:S-(hydroxymethyl)glutathione dehydrogenase / alcohol dehydrogenase